METLLEFSGKQRQDCLIGIIRRENFDLYMDIFAFECIKISQAGRDGSEAAKKKYIEAPINRAANGIKWKVDVNQEHEKKNVWLAFLDKEEKRVIVSVWYGTKCRQIV